MLKAAKDEQGWPRLYDVVDDVEIELGVFPDLSEFDVTDLLQEVQQRWVDLVLAGRFEKSIASEVAMRMAAKHVGKLFVEEGNGS